ncbi:MAG: histidinol dehydrogenase [Candidatus Diapherotrites archaeon CG10_big_fil_rev_8_21_14_0_10_31_34]|nr:MAG: histidinol dehydrogenase [Candidatus Diapherotrites archaeon CG10_big_fil_rev_8_21_14_0_10_31_34]
MMEIIEFKEIKQIKDLMKDKEEETERIEDTVKEIIKEVQKKRDKAIIELTEKFDKVKLKEILVSKKEIREAYKKISKKELNALKFAKKNLEKSCKKQLPKKWFVETRKGVKIGEIIRPIENIGVYVPGGKYPYPSSVLMNLVPARTAGCKEIVLCTPPRKDGSINPFILVAADLCKVNKIAKIGGAQAIAAMAFGTKKIPKVDKIMGPGNIFVATAKKMVFGRVGIDSIAGPSECCILARKGNSKFIASEILAQAEHDELAKTVLVTTNKNLALQTKKEVLKQMQELETQEVIKKSLQENGVIVLTKTRNQAIEVVNELASEHLIVFEDNKKTLEKIKCAGSIFVGEFSPVAAGDYCSGTNHILPTGRTARFSSGLNVRDFLVTQYIQKISKKGLKNLLKTIEVFADIEGLPAHKNSAKIRFK